MARILLVDDDQSSLDMLRRGLEGEGHAVTTAAGGSDAQSIFDGAPDAFDLLITDVSMPDVDGVTVAEAAIARKPSLQVIVMSGLAGELARAEALKSDRVRVVSKPLSLEQLKAEVASAMAG